jgi:hypothetical protein
MSPPISYRASPPGGVLALLGSRLVIDAGRLLILEHVVMLLNMLVAILRRPRPVHRPASRSRGISAAPRGATDRRLLVSG